MRRSGGPTRLLPSAWRRTSSAPPPLRTRKTAARNTRTGGEARSWSQPSPATPVRQVTRPHTPHRGLGAGAPQQVKGHGPCLLSAGGDVTSLDRTGRFMRDTFQSGTLTCLICISSVRRSQAVRRTRGRGHRDTHTHTQPPSLCPGVELLQLFLPLPPAVYSEVGSRLRLPGVLCH